MKIFSRERSRHLPHLLALIIILAAVGFLTSGARCQENDPQLPVKIGDRVELHGIVDSKGTVLEIGTGDKKNCYRVRYDNAAPDDQGTWLYSHGVQGYIFLLGPDDKVVGDIYAPRPGKAEEAPAKTEEAPAAAGNSSAAAEDSPSETEGGQNGEMTPPAPETHPAPKSHANGQPKLPAGIPPKHTPIAKPAQKKVKHGPPSLDLVKKMIRFLWEGMSDDYSTINVDLHTVQIGKPRLWKQSWSDRDMGSGIPGKTLIYPVHTVWTQRRYEHSQIVITEIEGVHNFYINAFGVWQCGLAESKELRPLRTIPLQ